MEKITMQDIADALDISRVTVSKVFNNQSGVSDSLRELVFEKARELGYAKVPYQMVEQQKQSQRTISLIVSRPDSAFSGPTSYTVWPRSFPILILISCTRMCLPPTAKSFTLPSILLNGQVDGVVVLNIYDAQILGMINELSLPKVFLDTVPSLPNHQLNGDLILIEGFRTVYEITGTLIRNGHKNIGFLGDINYAQTNLERYKGYCSCMEKTISQSIPAIV